MLRLATYGTIAVAVERSLNEAEVEEDRLMEALEDSAASSLVLGLQAINMQVTILAIGSISIFESLLQQDHEWEKPFSEIDQCLREGGHKKLAERFLHYRLAVNVLKHGKGPSYDRLLASKTALPFRIKEKMNPSFSKVTSRRYPLLSKLGQNLREIVRIQF